MTSAADVAYEWRGALDGAEVEALHAEGFGHEPLDWDWAAQLERHSLGWVCARRDGRLVGFVNVAWDGAGHAFVLDTLVALVERRRGVGTTLVEIAAREAAAAGCEWLHVDYEDHLGGFYVESCGFTPCSAGVLRLRPRAG